MVWHFIKISENCTIKKKVTGRNVILNYRVKITVELSRSGKFWVIHHDMWKQNEIIFVANHNCIHLSRVKIYILFWEFQGKTLDALAGSGGNVTVQDTCDHIWLTVNTILLNVDGESTTLGSGRLLLVWRGGGVEIFVGGEILLDQGRRLNFFQTLKLGGGRFFSCLTCKHF